MRSDNRPLRQRDLAALGQVPQVVDQARELANAIRKDARALAPSVTGRLARGIAVERVYDPAVGIFFLVGWSQLAWYGLMVENGTEDADPRPHLVPAALKHGAIGGDR